MALSQVPIVTLMLLQKTQLGSIWSSLIVGLVSTAIVALFLYGAHKSKLLNLKSKLFTINDAPRIALSYVAVCRWKYDWCDLVATSEANNYFESRGYQ